MDLLTEDRSDAVGRSDGWLLWRRKSIESGIECTLDEKKGKKVLFFGSCL